MSTDLPAPREGHTAPDDTTPEELPAWARQIDWANLTPGHITKVPADGDLPAGYVEVVHPAEYQRNLERAVAIERGPSGRAAYAARLAARGTGILIGWTATGTIATALHAHRYYRAHDYAECLGLPLDEAAEKKVRSRRRERWRVIGWSAAALAALNAAGWGALVWGAGMTAAGSWAIIPGAEGMSLLAGLTAYGHYRKQHQVLPGQVVAPQHAAELEAAVAGDPVERPVPTRFQMGMPASDFHRMLNHALTEKIGVSLTDLTVTAEPWGYLAHLVLDSCTPSTVTDKLDLLESCLPGVRTSSIMPQQSSESRNEMIMRIPGPDPWAALPELPYRAPHSVPSNELHQAPIGADMSTKPLALPMVRTSINLVGISRSGKSTLLRSILDALTATPDRIIIGIDLGSAGSGFGEYRQAMHAVATTPEQARTVLEWALDIGTKRPVLFRRKGMGQNWATSPETPGITIVVDEFPALVKKSSIKGRPELVGEKIQMMPWGLDAQLAELFVTSAKSDVTLIIAGQGVTREKVRDNTWVTEMPVQVMCACDKDDVGQILHTGAMGEGWLPNRLMPAMPPAINDASVCYVMAGAGYNEPITYRASTISAEEEARRANERAKAGLVELDAASARLSRHRLEDITAECADPDWGEEDDESVRATGHVRGDAAAVMQAHEVDRMRSEVLVDALREWSDRLYGDLTVESLRDRIKAAGGGSPVQLGRIDGMANGRGYRLVDLTE